jgi:hypothetical protein
LNVKIGAYKGKKKECDKAQGEQNIQAARQGFEMGLWGAHRDKKFRPFINV